MSPLELIDSAASTGLRRILAAMGTPPLRVVLWDGRACGASEDAAEGTIRIHDRRALARLLADPEYQAAELYTEGRLSIEGDLIGLLCLAYRGHYERAGLGSRILSMGRLRGVLRNDLRSARRSARHHYDVGNDFYALWLDERMVYTCAYFPDPSTGLEEAQLAKFDHVARKLDLREGERVIEAGCGWGTLALHMARYYGVHVRAFNVSAEQIAYAREQAEKSDLQDRVEFIEDDYRNATGRCEKFVSVGMLEHVGPAHYRDLGDVIDRCLEPGGLGFLHTIGRSRPLRLNRWIDRRVFPNAHAPTLREMMDVLEPNNLVVLDVENLRRHYALTLRHWGRRFERSRTRIEQLVGPSLTRTWELYLAGAAAAFETGSLQLFQVLFARATDDRVPWTREHVYAGGHAALHDEL